MIKLLFIMIDLQGGGAERVLLNLLRYLNPQKYKITLLLLKKQGKYWDEIPKQVYIIAILDSDESLRSSWLRILRKGFQEAQKHDIIIGGAELLPTYLAYFWGSALRKPVIGLVHTAIEKYLDIMPRWQEIIARIVYKRITHLVFVSNGARLEMERWLQNTKKTTWQTIYNIFDPSIYDSHSEGGLSIGADIPFVISVGRLDKNKNHALLINAHALVLKKGYRHKLMILGEGKEQENIETLINFLGVKDSIMLPGFVPNPLDYVKQASIFVLPSQYEGFGMVLLEAMSVGVPVISTDCVAGPREILGDNKFGLLVPVSDADSLSKAILTLLNDKALRKEFSQKGFIRVKDFSYERIIPSWENLFDNLAS